MSGHSKWSSIKHKKALTDKKRGQIFSKLSKLITIAARKGSDPKLNPALAQIIERVRSSNMPNANIERAIKKVSDKSDYLEEIVIEILGPGGVALKVKAITDNRNRTITEIRKIINDHNAKMVQPGSLSWMFNNEIKELKEKDNKNLTELIESLGDHSDIDTINTNLSS